jgi:hypothetical protein
MNIDVENVESSLRRFRKSMKEEKIWNAPIVGDKSLRKFFLVSLLRKGRNHHLLVVLWVSRQDFLEPDGLPVVHRLKLLK